MLTVYSFIIYVLLDNNEYSRDRLLILKLLYTFLSYSSILLNIHDTMNSYYILFWNCSIFYYEYQEVIVTNVNAVRIITCD